MKLAPAKYRRLVFDAETDGLLHQVTVCHCVCVRDYDTGQRWTFRRNKRENTIPKLFALLDSAEEIWGHNIVAYDIPMLERLFDWTPKSRIRDTLVLARLIFPDQRDKDFRLHEAGKLDGKLIGKHTLDSWGMRLGMYKGDYKAIKEEEGLAKGYLPESEEMRKWVWGTWTQELEDYCMNDVEVTSLLVKMIEQRESSPDAVYVQHRLADLMARQQENGFPFDHPRALMLADDLKNEQERLEELLAIKFPGRYVPTRRADTPPIGRRIKGDGVYPDFYEIEHEPNRTKAIEEYVPERHWYGVPELRERASPNWKDPLKSQYVAGAWFTPVKWQEFKATSRPQIVDRLKGMGWDPEEEDYTEKGNVKANDVILRRISGEFPIANDLADLLAIRKLMGQLVDGKQAWLKNYNEQTGCIHGYCNPCGAVTTRATHAFPNLAQIPSVRKKKAKVADLNPIKDAHGIVRPNAVWKDGPVLVMLNGERCDDWAELDSDEFKTDDDGNAIVDVVILGLKGGWGYECRSLFIAPDGWVMVGSDLAGIELRCLAHRMAKYDGGEYGRVLLESDIHTFNQGMFELETRDQAKTVIYACVPMDTTTLTRTGWKTYDQIEVGEEVLTYNSKTGMKEWKPVLEKVFYEDAPVTEIRHNHSFSIRSTPNHRWFTRRRSASAKRGHYMVPEIATTERLTTEHNIITNAPMTPDVDGSIRPDIFSLPKYGTDWIEIVCNMNENERLAFLVGFCLADGHQNKKSGAWGWVQNKGDLYEAALTASYLTHGGNLHVSHKNGHNGKEMAAVRLSKKGHVTCQKIERIEHENQPVWCIRTENESWVIRQGDCITITGNTLYGAGDEKIGSIVSPLSPPAKQAKIGKDKKTTFSRNLPAFNRVMRDTQKQARRKYIEGLDGRRLFVRSKHAALNTDLQGMGATIANWWLIFIEDMLLDEGLEYGWDADWVSLAWIHDEIQIACRAGLEERIKQVCIAAAKAAGEYLDFALPVDASADHGFAWSDTH